MGVDSFPPMRYPRLRINEDASSIHNHMNDNTPQLKPRRDLRIEAFRKFEPYIAQALEADITINPKLLKMTPSTFITRFRDALRAYKLYHYPSDRIPVGTNLDGMRADETITDEVFIRNGSPDALTMREKRKQECSDDNIMRDILRKMQDRIYVKDIHYYCSYERYFEILQLKKADPYCWGVVVGWYDKGGYMYIQPRGEDVFDLTTPEGRKACEDFQIIRRQRNAALKR